MAAIDVAQSPRSLVVIGKEKRSITAPIGVAIRRIRSFPEGWLGRGFSNRDIAATMPQTFEADVALPVCQLTR
jgi:hypothetical protein